jgi:hypothetical protein
MSADERAWLARKSQEFHGSAHCFESRSEKSCSYIASRSARTAWFYYITSSLQKSAQCNVRLGVEKEGTDEFGGAREVRECSD